MYDLWFTLGAAVIDPTLLEKIRTTEVEGFDPMTDPVQFGPAFEFVERVVLEKRGNRWKTRQGPSTGLVSRKNTRAIRTAISGFLRARFRGAPPVGVYTAGRFCQYMKIERFQTTDSKSSFQDIVDLSKKAFDTANGQSAPTLDTFPALVGMCLLDSQVASRIRNAASLPADAELAEILSEFGLTDPAGPDWKALKAFVGDEGGPFDRAAFNLMLSDNNPWNEGGFTGEQILFWAEPDPMEKGRHVIP